MFLYILGAGTPNPDFATGADSYYSMITHKARYKGDEMIFCSTGAAFTYQWTHAFVDFRNMVDREQRDWFANPRTATRAARQYAIDKADEIKGLGENSSGTSACMSPTTFYSGKYGSLPTGYPGTDEGVLLLDGTVATYGSLAFMPFTPRESTAALESMYMIPGLVGEYGLYDAYSFMTQAEDDQPWIGESYLRIHKGLVALMFENYSSRLVWRPFHQSEHVQKALGVLGVGPVGDE